MNPQLAIIWLFILHTSSSCPDDGYKYSSQQCHPLLYNNNTGKCSCSVVEDRHSWIKCIKGELWLQKGVCASFNASTRHMYTIECPFWLPRDINFYNYSEQYLLLPHNMSDAELNEYICSIGNRKGFLCNECIERFGPSPMLLGYQCANCTAFWYDFSLYIILQFVPATIFYLLILTFQVNLTSAPMLCFVMYSQLVILAFSIPAVPNPQLIANTKLATSTKVILTLYGVWNLDFLRYVIPPICVSSGLKRIHLIYFDYISAFYPQCLIILTWILIELHDRNCRLLVWLWRPFHKCFVHLRRGWSKKTGTINVFASFFLLSYNKLIYLGTMLLNCRNMYTYDLDLGNKTASVITTSDFSVHCDRKESYKYFIPPFLIFCIFNVLPTIILTLYPTKVFRWCLSKSRLHRMPIVVFVEKYHGCYRDGFDGGRDMRSFSGLYFFLRIVIPLSNPVFGRVPLLHQDYSLFPAATILMLTAMLISFVKPYKETSMNLLDALLLTHLAFVCFFFISSSHNEQFENEVIFKGNLHLFTPIAVFCVVVSSHKLKALVKRSTTKCRCLMRQRKGTISLTENKQEQRKLLTEPTTSEITIVYGT